MVGEASPCRTGRLGRQTIWGPGDEPHRQKARALLHACEHRTGKAGSGAAERPEWLEQSDGGRAAGEGRKGVFRVAALRCLVTVPVNMFSHQLPEPFHLLP